MQNSDTTQPDGPHVIPYGGGYLDGEEPHHQWYPPEIVNPTDQSSSSNPKPTTQVTWSDNTKPPASSGSTPPSKSSDFQLSMNLAYRDGMAKSVAVVYEGASADSLTCTIRIEDGSKLHIHDSNLELIYQPDFSKLPKTHLGYRNEVGTGFTL